MSRTSPDRLRRLAELDPTDPDAAEVAARAAARGLSPAELARATVDQIAAALRACIAAGSGSEPAITPLAKWRVRAAALTREGARRFIRALPLLDAAGLEAAADVMALLAPFGREWVPTVNDLGVEECLRAIVALTPPRDERAWHAVEAGRVCRSSALWTAFSVLGLRDHDALAEEPLTVEAHACAWAVRLDQRAAASVVRWSPEVARLAYLEPAASEPRRWDGQWLDGARSPLALAAAFASALGHLCGDAVALLPSDLSDVAALDHAWGVVSEHRLAYNPWPGISGWQAGVGEPEWARPAHLLAGVLGDEPGELDRWRRHATCTNGTWIAAADDAFVIAIQLWAPDSDSERFKEPGGAGLVWIPNAGRVIVRAWGDWSEVGLPDERTSTGDRPWYRLMQADQLAGGRLSAALGADLDAEIRGAVEVAMSLHGFDEDTARAYDHAAYYDEDYA